MFCSNKKIELFISTAAQHVSYIWNSVLLYENTWCQHMKVFPSLLKPMKLESVLMKWEYGTFIGDCMDKHQLCRERRNASFSKVDVLVGQS